MICIYDFRVTPPYRYGGSDYYLTSSHSWEEGMMVCQEVFGHIVRIEDAGENDFLRWLLRRCMEIGR